MSSLMSRQVQLPVIDVAALAGGIEPEIGRLHAACSNVGAFVLEGHRLDQLGTALAEEARGFFDLPAETKERIAMVGAGRAWRGWFPVGAELTSGVPDSKEGLYFGIDEIPDGRMLRGHNLFPADRPRMRPLVDRFMEEASDLARVVVAALDTALGLGGRLVEWTREPLVLFRIFRYPPTPNPPSGAGGAPDGAEATRFVVGAGEHTDYGLLTLLYQADVPGLEVRAGDEWVEAPAGSLVCNLGDMIERATAGLYRSAPHRVINRSNRSRMSMPFFFDPGWDTEVETLVGPVVSGTACSVRSKRWDGADLQALTGRYGDYVTARVSKVFPDLSDGVASE